MNLSRIKNNDLLQIEEITESELKELRARELEDEFDFEDLKKYSILNKKLTSV